MGVHCLKKCCILCLFLCSCCVSTYRQQTARLHKNIKKGSLDKALKILDKNQFLQKKRNQLLYCLEKGTLLYLKNEHQKSNQYFHQADYIIENNFLKIEDILLSTTINPQMRTYLGEDFEKVAIHYYKAMNFIALKKYDAALVEARRINIRLQKINLKYPDNQRNRYHTDVFAIILQGALYESTGDYNNAFIAYRNAVNQFLTNDQTFLGVTIPKQLIEDLFNMADKMGFKDELQRYEQLFKQTFRSNNQSHGSLVLFLENGHIPYKDQTYYNFVSSGFKDGIFFMENPTLGLTIPIPEVTRDQENNFNVLRVAFPKYVSHPLEITKATVTNKVYGKTYTFQPIENYEHIAFKTLKDRTMREIGAIVLRSITKKLGEYTLKETQRDLGNILGLINTLTESSDTRNWQSLPRNISYIRVPLKKGGNNITINLYHKTKGLITKTMNVRSNGKMQIRSFNYLHLKNMIYTEKISF